MLLSELNVSFSDRLSVGAPASTKRSRAGCPFPVSLGSQVHPPSTRPESFSSSSQSVALLTV